MGASMRARTILQMVLIASFIMMVLTPAVQYISSKFHWSMVWILTGCEIVLIFYWIPQWIAGTFLEISCSFLVLTLFEQVARYLQKCVQNRQAHIK